MTLGLLAYLACQDPTYLGFEVAWEDGLPVFVFTRVHYDKFTCPWEEDNPDRWEVDGLYVRGPRGDWVWEISTEGPGTKDPIPFGRVPPGFVQHRPTEGPPRLEPDSLYYVYATWRPGHQDTDAEFTTPPAPTETTPGE